MGLLSRSVRTIVDTANDWRPRHWAAVELKRKEAKNPVQLTQIREKHLFAAMNWIRRAQDSCRGGGVSWGFRSRSGFPSTKAWGWAGPYPETTGYIINTMLRFGIHFDNVDALERARRMADWEVSIQMPSGAYPGGIYEPARQIASTFVTGQVIFGLIHAYRHFQHPPYLEAAKRAADYLLDCLNGQGEFVKGQSTHCVPGPKAYESRTAWAMALVGQETGNESYKEAARAVAGFALRCQHSNGWFSHNDPDLLETPLTHTISYVLEGLFALGKLLQEPRYRKAVDISLASISACVQPNGFLSGRLTSSWQPAASWACLTGSAQIAGVYLRANTGVSMAGYRDVAEKLLSFVSFTQELADSHEGLGGGIHGSYPIDGGYGTWCSLNWATKFYADSVMDWLSVPESGY